MYHFEGKVGIVTGAAQGIGKAVALAFAKEGAKLVLADIQDSGQAVADEINAADGEAFFIKTDISDGDAVKAMAALAVDKFGRLDFACNNAGTEGIPGALADTDEANYEKIFSTNVKGTWLCMKHEIQQMLQQETGGRIVNVASFVGLVGFPGVPLYSASKHAIIGMTRTAALEYIKAGVRINAVCPGVVDTPMVDRFTGGDAEAKAGLGGTEPIGRLQTPDEVAQAVLWLCSDAASFSVASLLVSDGGITAQ